MNNKQKLYFIGIKGVGTSALAIVAKGLGYNVSGSDVAEEFITDSSLKDAGIMVNQGFDADNVTPDISTVVVSAAYGESNPEFTAAQELHIPIISYGEMLGQISSERKTIAVCGTHGKTTTTSLLAFLLFRGELDPSWIIGTGHVAGLPSHGHAGQGEYFVAEGDEYRAAATDNSAKFLYLTPTITIITSLEYDHPDVYPTPESYLNAFEQLVQKMPSGGTLIISADDANAQRIIDLRDDITIITYGFSETASVRIENIESTDPSQMHFRLIAGGNTDLRHPERPSVLRQGVEGLLRADAWRSSMFALQLPGNHNIMNATAAIIAARLAGLRDEKIKTILPQFSNTERRFDILGTTANGVTVVDDYAHHPTAVSVTLKAARDRFPNRQIWCVFQSHTYSRTKALFNEFSSAFTFADTVIITDIFASARESDITVTGEELAEAVAKHNPDTRFMAKQDLLDYLRENVPANAVVITMGAGDIYKIGKEFLGK